MKKKCLYVYLTTLSLFLTFLLFLTPFSCASIKQPKTVYETPDYTVEDIKTSELKTLKKIAEDFPIKALWRVTFLGDNEALLTYLTATVDLTRKALVEKDYFLFAKYTACLNTFFDTLTDKNFTYPNKLQNVSDALNLTTAKEKENNEEKEAKEDKEGEEDGYLSSSFMQKLLEYKEEVKTLETENKEELDKALKKIPGLTLTKKDKEAFPKTIAECIDATVTVWVDKGIKIEGGAGFPDRVLGSGFFISKDGYIVTNHHVISDVVDKKASSYSRLFIKLSSDNSVRIPAKVVGYDKTFDLALLKTAIEAPYVLALGDSKTLSIGESVHAIGTPLGLNGTVTQGIISAENRQLFTTGGVLQLDAAVNSGNSGGPCINKDFLVQAVVFAGILHYQGLNFAIPVEYLTQDLPYLYRGGERKVSFISAYGETYKEGSTPLGVEVLYVMPGGECYRAGIKAGDIITFINDSKINTLEDLQKVMRGFTSEMLLKVSYLSEGEARTALVYCEERPEAPGLLFYNSDVLSSSFYAIFGFSLLPSSTMNSRRYIIDKIITGSVADEAGFCENDTVTVLGVDFAPDNSYIGVTVETKRRKGGYINVVLGISAPLDDSKYF